MSEEGLSSPGMRGMRELGGTSREQWLQLKQTSNDRSHHIVMFASAAINHRITT